ncbi:recombinase family protein [Sedimentibacter sp.]|uniref:recombinase family protein n=2 Tax=Sedimentibacter sp. TaxID=1960295 RepID=UPI0028A07284|nr:recombinase family protein [Sedimentibacter sp.]
MEEKKLRFMGYSKDDKGELIIVQEEAKVIKRIIDWYLQGFGVYRLTRQLEGDGIKTATGSLNGGSSG